MSNCLIEEFSHSILQQQYDPKIDQLYYKAMITDKMLIYEDDYVRLGCIRSVSLEWRQATIKIFINNKHPTKDIDEVYFKGELQYMQLRDEDKFPLVVHPNDQYETVIYVGGQIHTTPYVHFCYK